MSKRKRNTNVQMIDAQIDRVQSRIIRYANTLQKLRQARKRALANPPAKPFDPMPEPKPTPLPPDPAPAPKPTSLPSDLDKSLDIPTELRRAPVIDQRSEATKTADRKRLVDLNDAEAAAQIEAEQTELKKKKAVARIAKLKAKQSGETRKMPLSGKAALDHIRNSE